jgi:hypothetical protein
MYFNFGKSLYTIIYILLATIAIMMLLSYFNIDLKENTNDKLTLSRAAVFEGYNKVDLDDDTAILSTLM